LGNVRSEDSELSNFLLFDLIFNQRIGNDRNFNILWWHNNRCFCVFIGSNWDQIRTVSTEI